MENEKNSGGLFNRVLKNLNVRRDRVLSGKINCIPWGLPRFERENPGIEQGKYYLPTASSKIGKTQLTQWLFVFNPIRQIIDNGLNVRLKIFYFCLEMTPEESLLSIFSNILYLKEGVRIPPKDLKSTNADNPIDKNVLELIKKHEVYFKKVEEIITFISDVRTPSGIYSVMEHYAEENGTTHYKTVETSDGEKDSFDYYKANDSDEYVMCIIDHISLISPQRGKNGQMSLRDSIGLLSSNFLVKLRNRYNQIPVVIQQQSAATESIDSGRARQNKPSLDGLGDNKTTQRDANLILGLYSPFRYSVPQYQGYDITTFRDNIRFMEILGGREGGAGAICPLYFDGAVNYFKEMPKPDNELGLNAVKKLINKFKK